MIMRYEHLSRYPTVFPKLTGLRTGEFAELLQDVLPRYSHPKSPQRFTQPQLVACVLLLFYLDPSYRDMEEWLLATDKVCQTLELKRVPDHSMLSRTFKKLRQSDLSALKDELLQQIGVEEEVVAGDSTRFRLCQASAYYQTRRGQQFRDWVKGAYAVVMKSRLVLAWRSGAGSLPDFGFLQPLKRQAAAYGRNGKPIDPKRKKRADLVSAARLAGLYGQRWLVETVNSVVKRKFGDTIRSRSLRLQRCELLVKALVYNIHV